MPGLRRETPNPAASTPMPVVQCPVMPAVQRPVMPAGRPSGRRRFGVMRPLAPPAGGAEPALFVIPPVLHPPPPHPLVGVVPFQQVPINMAQIVQVPINMAQIVQVPINLAQIVRMQIEHYFSDTNLRHDLSLRRKMDGSGWVDLHAIANINRIAQMTRNLDLIKTALEPSNIVELRGNKVRRRGDWSRWIPAIYNYGAW